MNRAARGTVEHVTIVQLARFGDVLQTSPLIRNLRRDPSRERHITMLVDRRSAPAAILLEGVDRVAGIDLGSVPVAGSKESLAYGYQAIREWASEWRDGAVADRVLVLNQGVLPSAIASLVPCETMEGPVQGRSLPVPHRYLNAALADRRFNPVHLAEVWGAYGPPLLPLPAPALKPSLGTPFAKHGGRESETPFRERRFAVNVSAGAAGRRPEPEKLAELIRGLCGFGAERVLLLGTAADRKIANRLIALLPEKDREHVQDLVGHTTIEELPGLLDSVAVLVSADTGTLQLAAATAARPLGLFFGGANPVETGPYISGGVAVVHPDTIEQDELTGQNSLKSLNMRLVADLAWKMAHGEENFEELDDAFHPFALLVAGPSPLGVRYRNVRPGRPLNVGAGERWLPLLERLLYPGAYSQEEEERGKLSGGDSRSAGVPGPGGRLNVGVDDLSFETPMTDAEKRWIGAVLKAFGIDPAGILKNVTRIIPEMAHDA